MLARQMIVQPVLIFFLVLLVAACNKNKVEKETLWGVYHEPVKAQALPRDSGIRELKELWKSNIGKGTTSGFAQLKPAYFEGSVFVVDRKGDVYRREVSTGKIVWNRKLGKNVNNGVDVSEGLLLLSHDNGSITALYIRDGSTAWETALKRSISAIPIVGQSRVIVRTSDGLIVGLNAQTGDQVWQVKKEVPDLTVQGDSVPAITGDAVLVGLSNGKLIANNIINGRDYWEAKLSFVRGQNELERLNDSDTPPIIKGTTVYAATYQGGVTALQIQNASTIWRTEVSTRLPMVVVGDSLIVTQELGKIVSINSITGEIRWTQEAFMGHGVSHPVVVKDRIIIGDASGRVHTLNINSGILVETKKMAKGAILSLVTDRKIVTLFTSEGQLITLTL